jgi:hypothetical protein
MGAACSANDGVESCGVSHVDDANQSPKSAVSPRNAAAPSLPLEQQTCGFLSHLRSREVDAVSPVSPVHRKRVRPTSAKLLSSEQFYGLIHDAATEACDANSTEAQREPALNPLAHQGNRVALLASSAEHARRNIKAATRRRPPTMFSHNSFPTVAYAPLQLPESL